MRNRTKIDVIKGLFGYKLFLFQDWHVFQPMKVLLIVDLYSTVVIGTDSWIALTRRKTPKKRRSKEKLILPSMNG